MTDNASMFRTYVGIDKLRFDHITDCLVQNLAAIGWEVEHASVADIGAFDGGLTKLALTKLTASGRASGIRYLTLVEPDLDVEVCPENLANAGSVKVCRQGFSDLTRELPESSCDLICLFHSLYHCTDFVALTQELEAIVADKGIVYAVLDDTNTPFYDFLREVKRICLRETSEYGHLVRLDQFLDNYSGEQILLRSTHNRNVRIHSVEELFAISVFVGRFDIIEMEINQKSVLGLFRSRFGAFPVDLRWREQVVIVQPKKGRCNV